MAAILCKSSRQRARYKRVSLVVTLCLAILLPVSAAASDAAKGEDKVLIRIHENNPEAKTTFFNLATNEVLLKPSDGYVEILRGQTVLTALEVTYAQEEQKAVLTGEVCVYQPDLDLVSEKLTAWFESESYVAEGNVHVLQWNLDEADQRRDRKLNLAAHVVTMKENGNLLHAEQEVYVEETDRCMWADILDYDGREEMMVLTGNVRIETESGSKLSGNRVVMDLATDEATVYGPVQAEFVIEEQDAEDSLDSEEGQVLLP